MYAGFELLVDDHKWFNASKFCHKYADKRKQLKYFSKTDSFPRLVEHIRQNLQLDPVRDRQDDVDRESIEYGAYYHPLLFLALTLWINLDFYVKAAHIVFSHFSSYDRNESIKMLALGERAGYTTAVLPTNIVVEPVPSTSTYLAKSPVVCEPEIVIKRIPSKSMDFTTTSPIVYDSDTTTINTPAYEPNTKTMTPKSKTPFSLTWIDESSSSTFADRDEEMVMETNYTKAEMELEREEWQLRLDHMERQHQLELEKAQYELSQRLSQKEHEERSLREQLKNKEFDDNELRKQLETIEAESKQRECELHQRLEHNREKARQLRTQLIKKESEIEKSSRENEQRLEQMCSRQELEAAEREKHSYFLRDTKERRQIDELTRQLKQMSLSNERLRMTTLKRNPIMEKQNLIRKVHHAKSGTDRLEILVLTSFDGPGQQFYGFRRKLKGAFYAIYRQMQVAMGERVTLWFVSNNATQDFIGCKSYLSDEADKTGVNLQTHNNTIGFEESTNIETFDTVSLLRNFGRLAAVTLAIFKLRKQKKKRTRRWSKEWFKLRSRFTHENLLNVLRDTEPEDYKNFLRMDQEGFETLLELVRPKIEKQDTIMRKAIPAKAALELAQSQYTPPNQLDGEDITEVLLRRAETQSDQMSSDIYKYVLNDYKRSFI
ncbi:hypothetical protein QTP88_015038 [Uroleucon formosanum]